jgi:hypothetical protein
MSLASLPRTTIPISSHVKTASLSVSTEGMQAPVFTTSTVITSVIVEETPKDDQYDIYSSPAVETLISTLGATGLLIHLLPMWMF